MNKLNKKLTYRIWLSRLRQYVIGALILVSLFILAFYLIESEGEEIDGVIVGVTRSQTTLSSGTVLVVDVGDPDRVMVPVQSVSIPKKGQKVVLLRMSTVIPGYNRYKFLGYRVAKSTKE